MHDKKEDTIKPIEDFSVKDKEPLISKYDQAKLEEKKKGE
jgi:hypothetical protein